MHDRNTTNAGFTIVELLVVVVVIAILATISVVSYTGISDRAHLSVASAEARQAAEMVHLFGADNDAFPTSLDEAGMTDTDDIQYIVNNDTVPKSFCITATSGNKSAWIDRSSSVPKEGGCAGHGVGGIAAITNLAMSPRATETYIGSSDNPSIWSLTKGVTVPATPDGITTAMVSQPQPGQDAQGYILAIYNFDGLWNNSGVDRSVSLWVRINAEGYQVHPSWVPYFSTQSIPANTWVRVQTTQPIPGDGLAGLRIHKSSGIVSIDDRAWVTGIMAVEGAQNYPFADGNTSGWIWNGASLASSSTGPAP